MTSLTITPNSKNKKLAIAGVAAIGEPIAVIVKDFASEFTVDLHLRVIFQGRVIATFPMRADDEWDTSGDDLTCVLDLNTDIARMLCRAPENCCLFTLEDTGHADPDTRRLWAIGEHELRGWPLDGVAAHPYPLSKIPSLIQTWEAWILEWRDEVSNLDITAEQTSTGCRIVITRKDGEETAVTLTNGQDGQPGADGTSAIVTVGQVSTLPPGSPATVENVGTPTEAVFNFGIPQGEKGENADLDDIVTETSANPVKSSGIWNWVKSLLPDWLNKNYAEPATTASVSAEEQRAKAIELDLRRRVENLGSSKADKATIYTRSEVDSALEDKANASETYTKTETDEKINQFAAHYLTVDAIGSAFATKSALDEATVFYYAGQAFTPTKNDYCVVLEDESKDGKATRYAFVGEWGDGGSWQYQYTINNTAFTQEQWDAINSGATDEKIAEIDNKADISHTHEQSDVTGLSAALSGKLDQTGESDLRLNGGASIYFDGEEWLTRVDSMVSQYSWDWSSIYNTPTTLAGYGIEDAAKTSDIPSLSGQTFDISVDAQFKNMCIATARALGAVVTHTTDDTSTGGQVAQAYGITPTDATTFGELQTKAGLGDSAVIGDL